MPITEETYPVGQKTSDEITRGRCDYWAPERCFDNDAKSFRFPILCFVTVRVHDEDDKNPHVSCCDSPTDDTPPAARRSFRGTDG